MRADAGAGHRRGEVLPELSHADGKALGAHAGVQGACFFSGFAWGAVDQAPQVCGELRLPALQVEEVGPQDPTGRIAGKDLHRNGLLLQLEEEPLLPGVLLQEVRALRLQSDLGLDPAAVLPLQQEQQKVRLEPHSVRKGVEESCRSFRTR